MRNPHDTRFIKVNRLMQSGQMVGFDRPIGRATWTKTRLRAVKSAKPGEGWFRYLNKRNEPEHEIWTLKTIDIDRSIGQDAATATITLWNFHATAPTEPEGVDTEGSLGYLTSGRGAAGMKGVTSIYRDENGAPYPTDWGYPENGYRDVFIPNTIIKTYQGYGSDNFDEMGEHRNFHDPLYVRPEHDTQLFRTGVWLIDKVTFGSDGTISLECRDFAKLLIEQVIYPPMIPLGRFPLVYHPAYKGHKAKIGRCVATYMSSSADRRRGSNTSIHGHRGTDAFDHKLGGGTFWLSPANDSRDAHEWLQGHIAGPINELKLHTLQGNYIAYISVYEDGAWQGQSSDIVPGTGEYDDDEGFRYVITHGDTLWDLADRYYGDPLLWPRIAHANDNIIRDPHWIYPGQQIKIPYITGTHNPPPAGAARHGVKYVKRVTIPHNVPNKINHDTHYITIRLPRTYKASRLRITFTHLQQIPGFDGYRVGVYGLHARYHRMSTMNRDTVNKAGYVTDWSEPIKELCAWAGFTWPDASQPDPLLGRAATPLTSLEEAHIHDLQERIRLYEIQLRKATEPQQKARIELNIEVLRRRLSTYVNQAQSGGTGLRVWGDFEDLGAGPIVSTDPDYFMNKTFMEGIRQIVDFIGGIFYVDETGGAQFRLANIWGAGNFIDDVEAPASLGARIKDHPIEFHDDANLVEYSVVIDDEALRSEILVVGGYPNLHSTSPVAGGYVTGYNPVTRTTSAIDFTDILAGQYRLMQVPGDSTQLFKSERECQRMAELTALFILFTYRQGALKAPAHPGLQIDDQVSIFERVSAERNIHYVSGIRTHQDIDSGEYTMDVTCHWLGQKGPRAHWFVNKAQLTPAVNRLPAIIKRVGKADTGSTEIPGKANLT